jgi:hypothetical protein
MAQKRVKAEAAGCGLTRRELLLRGAAAAVLLAQRRASGEEPAAASQTASSPATQYAPPWWVERHGPQSRVVSVRSERAVTASTDDPLVFEEMIDAGVRRLTGEPTAALSWRRILGAPERIAVKFNSVGARELDTNNALALTLVDRLEAAGFQRRAITLVEVPEYVIERAGCQKAASGWDGSVEVGDGREPLARYWSEADAVINVALLKTHKIAGMSCSLKNLSHAIIQHPARFHANGCSPYVGQIVRQPVVAEKLKLNLVNALRLVIRNGPEAATEDIVDYGALIFGFDPLATDQIGWSTLAIERHQRGMPGEIEVPYLVSAAVGGVGRWRPREIDHQSIVASG